MLYSVEVDFPSVVTYPPAANGSEPSVVHFPGGKLRTHHHIVEPN